MTKSDIVHAPYHKMMQAVVVKDTVIGMLTRRSFEVQLFLAKNYFHNKGTVFTRIIIESGHTFFGIYQVIFYKK